MKICRHPTWHLHTGLNPGRPHPDKGGPVVLTDSSYFVGFLNIFLVLLWGALLYVAI